MTLYVIPKSTWHFLWFPNQHDTFCDSLLNMTLSVIPKSTWHFLWFHNQHDTFKDLKNYVPSGNTYWPYFPSKYEQSPWRPYICHSGNLYLKLQCAEMKLLHTHTRTYSSTKSQGAITLAILNYSPVVPRAQKPIQPKDQRGERKIRITQKISYCFHGDADLSQKSKASLGVSGVLVDKLSERGFGGARVW